MKYTVQKEKRTNEPCSYIDRRVEVFIRDLKRARASDFRKNNRLTN